MRTFARVSVVLSLLACVAAPATAAPPASAAGRKTYVLQPRPRVGQRIAYEQSIGSTLRILADAGGNHRRETFEQSHDQTVVLCEQIVEIGKPPAISKLVRFGPGCWSATKNNDRPPRKVRSVYADKQVLFRIFEDGALEQDFGVKPTRQQMQRLKNMFVASADLYPDRPVAVGERWRADRAMGALLDLSPDDTSSTIFTLKEVREQDGRQVAVVAVSAAVIKGHDRGFNVEMSLEGAWQIDLETGVELKIDLAGTTSIAASAARGRARTSSGGVQIAGEGTFELHRAARLLEAEPASASESGASAGAAAN